MDNKALACELTDRGSIRSFGGWRAVREAFRDGSCLAGEEERVTLLLRCFTTGDKV